MSSPTISPLLSPKRAESAGGCTLRKIMVVVDPAAMRHAGIEKAARLASSFGSTLELYICDCDRNVPESWTPLAQYRSMLRERRLAMLEALAAPIRERGIPVLTRSEWRDPPERGIVDHAIESQADLVLKDADRHERTSYMPVSAVDETLISDLPMPLLLVRSATWPEHLSIATCVDPCHPAERPAALDESLLAVTCSISRVLSGNVSVLHALESPPHLPERQIRRSTVEADYQRQRDAVAVMASQAGVSGEALRFQDGHFPDSLIQLAKGQNSDLLVVGVAGRQRTGNGAGSTAWQVLQQTDSDLLVVKLPGFVNPAPLADRDAIAED